MWLATGVIFGVLSGIFGVTQKKAITDCNGFYDEWPVTGLPKKLHRETVKAVTGYSGPGKNLVDSRSRQPEIVRMALLLNSGEPGVAGCLYISNCYAVSITL